MWVNFATTGRWAGVAGSIRGAKEPLFVVALAATSVAVLWPWRRQDAPAWVGRLVSVLGFGLLTFSFFQWFPVRTWNQLPFLDNWPTRFQVTVDGLRLYRQAVGVGWQWFFLGGYPSSSDISQTLSTMAAIPMTVLGERIGFHLTHLLVLLCLPALVYLDFRLDPRSRPSALYAAGLSAVAVTSWFSFFMTRSGDTNSMNGVFCTIAALTGSHAAAANRRWGAPLLVGAMSLLGHCHTAFLAYCAMLLVVEGVFYRDARRLGRAAIAVAAGVATALPLTWESWRHPSYFTVSNADYPSPPFVLAQFLRKVYYNIEILAMPWRWFNDFTGLTRVMLPALVFIGWTVRNRAGYYAWAALAILGLGLLNSPVFGYALLRPVHLLTVLPVASLAAFFVQSRPPRYVLLLLTALVVVYLQMSWTEVPHLTDRRDADPVLVDHLQTLDGATILLENTFHRDMDGDPSRETQRTPFSAHFEAFLPTVTGKRFYAGLWDGWQWSVFRTNLLSGGAFKGRLITTLPRNDVTVELRKWGVRHVLVWSSAANAFFASHDRFVERWHHGLWTAYEYLDADPRSVVAATGAGSLSNLAPLEARVDLSQVRAGEVVVVRSNYYPEWTATVNGQPLRLFASGDQMAFRAPADGSYSVVLAYPRRLWLDIVALAALVLCIAACALISTPARALTTQAAGTEGDVG